MPAVHEGVGPFPLEAFAKSRNVDARLSDLVEHPVGVSTGGREPCGDRAVIGKRPQCLVRQGVDRVRGCKLLNIKHVRGRRIFRASAGEEQPLRQASKISQPSKSIRGQEAAVGRVGFLSNGNAEFVLQMGRQVFSRWGIPPADKQRGHRADSGGKPCVDPSLEATQVSLSCGEVLFNRKQQGHVYGNPSNDGLFDSWEALGSAGDLHKEIVTAGLSMECFC